MTADSTDPDDRPGDESRHPAADEANTDDRTNPRASGDTDTGEHADPRPSSGVTDTDRRTGSAGSGDGDTSNVPAIELADVTKEYTGGGGTVTALSSVDFAAYPGEFLAVMGPSGSGKSTMLNVIGLLDEPTEGTVRLDGEETTGLSIAQLTDRRREFVGFVFQNYHLLPTLTAVENVELPTIFTGSVRRGRARRLLERVGLGDRLDHRPSELSGGQKQRVAIARALVNEPDVVLADEPTGNLDTDTGERILELFREIVSEENVALVAVTHDPEVAEFADDVINLRDGVITDDE